jgi:hypothetical protein
MWREFRRCRRTPARRSCCKWNERDGGAILRRVAISPAERPGGPLLASKRTTSRREGCARAANMVAACWLSIDPSILHELSNCYRGRARRSRGFLEMSVSGRVPGSAALRRGRVLRARARPEPAPSLPLRACLRPFGSRPLTQDRYGPQTRPPLRGDFPSAHCKQNRSKIFRLSVAG